MALTKISVRGAREHNLKGVDIDLPRDSLIVITGLSGSGKSSLAFDTIYAEGQRRYVESLSAYARQFLEMMQKPDVEHIDGLSPAISIEQKTTSRNPRSTVATVTEIYDYMRLLWARVGVPYSPTTGLPIEAQTVSNMVDRVMALPDGTRLYLLAPVVRGRKGEYRKELAEWQKAGFTRVRIDGEMYGIEEAPALDKKFKHDIEVVVDRLAVKEGIETRLADSFEQALKLADGLAYVDLADGAVPGREDEAQSAGKMKNAGIPANRIVFSEKFACPVSGFTIPEIVNDQKRLKMFHPVHTFVSKFVTDFYAKDLHEPIFENGVLCYDNPEITDIQQYVQDNLKLLWEEYKRISKPEEYPVDLSEDCWSNKMQRIHEIKSKLKRELE